MIDANRLKLINDVFGHGGKSETEKNPTGDRFLKQLGIFLASHAKANIDEAYRLHGDEFTMLLQNMPLDVLEKRLSEFTALANENKNKDPLFPSMSIGVVVVDPAVSTNQVYWTGKADQAMYMAKRKAKENDPWKNTPSELLSKKMKEKLSSATDKKDIDGICREYFTVPTEMEIWHEKGNNTSLV
jgi:diguanylate cyclase (GGDEF)-like protein